MLRGRLRCALAAGCALLNACNDTSDLAPASPDSPWQVQQTEGVPAPPVSAGAAPKRFTAPTNTAVHLPSAADVDPSHVYSLVELIDIAQSRNPATRVAWEQARQAAINVGIARSAYLPALTASVLGGYQHAVAPIPSNLVPQGFITFNVQEVYPQLAVDYLLFDFGGRAAAVEAAKQLSIAGNAGFTATHQQVIFNVARAYFMLDGATAAVRAARQALADAQVVQRSAEALSGRGLATVVNVQIAQRETAQAQFDLAQANAAQHDAMYTLLAAMDLPPTTKLQIADASARPLPSRTERTVDDVLGAALRNRPDLLADVAKLRATDANITAARSAAAPKIGLYGNVQGNIGQVSVDGTPYLGVKEPQGRSCWNSNGRCTRADCCKTSCASPSRSARRQQMRWRNTPTRLCARWLSLMTRSKQGCSNTLPRFRCRQHPTRHFAVPAIPMRKALVRSPMRPLHKPGSLRRAPRWRVPTRSRSSTLRRLPLRPAN